jgi:hypothetical protein
MEASSSRIDRSRYPEAVIKAADHLTNAFEEGQLLPARIRFNLAGEIVGTDTILVNTFAFFIPDVQGTPPGMRDEDWPWVIYADQARQAYNVQIGD